MTTSSTAVAATRWCQPSTEARGEGWGFALINVGINGGREKILKKPIRKPCTLFIIPFLLEPKRMNPVSTPDSSSARDKIQCMRATNRCTLLGVGPVSKNVVDATIELA